MKRITKPAVSAALILLSTANARAISPYLEAWPTSTSDTCPAPCYQVRMFLEDFTRSLDITSIQMDIGVVDGAEPALLPVPPEESENVGEGNAFVEAITGGVGPLPWNLSATVGASPASGYDALVVNAASAPFDVGSLQARHDASVICVPAAACAIQLEGLSLNRIYLGFFNVTRTELGDIYYDPHFPQSGLPAGTPHFVVTVGNITGSGPAIQDLIRYNGSRGLVPFLPEPSPALLLAGVLALLDIGRRLHGSVRRDRGSPGGTSGARSKRPGVPRVGTR